MKKVTRISLSILLTVFTFMTFSGCKKFLDRKPLNVTLDDLPGGGLQGQIFGLYAGVRDGSVAGDAFGTIPWLAFHGFRSDDALKGSDPGDGSDWESIFDDFNYTKSHWANDTYWGGHYTLIGLTNTALQFADSLQLNDPASLVNIAEAKFFRAYAYFDLVRSYGQVPKIDFRVYDPQQGNVPKSTEEEIYALIDADLQYAEQYLPLQWEGEDAIKYPGRLTSGAAKTLHAKTLLYRKQWAQALGLLQDVMNSGIYKLHDNYSTIYTDEGELCDESIFEIQMYVGPGNVNYNGSAYGVSQGVRGAGDWNLGWGWNVPTQALVDAYEPGDPRENATILFSGKDDGIYGRTVPSYPGEVPRPYWNKKVYTNPTTRLLIGLNSGDWINQRILRYADVLLMAAEAANELGGADNQQLAVDLVEQIRARARKSGTPPPPAPLNVLPPIAFVNQAQMRTAIQQERRVEFGMEGERFFDLVRWGLADSVLAPLGYQHKHRYFPLPQGAIDKSNGTLVQNPEWP
jgi:starch-binding outer membrane protein, SusD/RagB family